MELILGESIPKEGSGGIALSIITNMNVYLLGDYGVDDLAWAEVEAALRQNVPDCVGISRTALPPFDTWACALALLQIHNQAGSNDIIFHNVAPRKDDTGPRINNEGEALCAGWSDRGTLVVGPDSGYSWSLVGPLLRSLHRVRCETGGSQFRSRDVFPQMIPLLLARAPGTLETNEHPTHPLPENRVLLIDGYGNIKTSLSIDPQPGAVVEISIGGASEEAHVAEGVFAVPEGAVALARGSSGGMWEIFVRGGSAGALFGFPPGGSEIDVL